jgi:hypothetical protein
MAISVSGAVVASASPNVASMHCLRAYSAYDRQIRKSSCGTRLLRKLKQSSLNAFSDLVICFANARKQHTFA